MNVLAMILLTEMVFLFAFYVIDKGMLVAPALFSCTVITVSTVFAMIGNAGWNVEMSWLTLPAITIGFLMILGADVLAQKGIKRVPDKEKIECRQILVSNRKANIIIIATVILTVLYCLDILRAGASMGHYGLKAINAVKGDKTNTNFLIRQGVKFVMAAAFVHMLIFANNVMIKKVWKKNWKHIIPVVCGVVCCIFTSVRTDVLRLLTALAVDYCILLFQSNGWDRKSTLRFLKRILPIAAVMAIFLTSVRFIVKGDNNATSNSYGLLEYMAYYIGTPIVVLGAKLMDGLAEYKGGIWGNLTFNQGWLLLQRIGLFQDVTLKNGSANVWIEEWKGILANVDTIFGPPLIDFGFLGMAIYIFALYWFLNRFFYKYIAKSVSNKKRDEKLLIYSYLATLVSMAYYTNLLNQFLTVYFAVTFVLMLLIYRFYNFAYLSEE